MTQQVEAGAAAPETGRAFGSFAYRTYVLYALLLVYIINFIDRGLLSVVARPLKAEIHISDTAWGLLTGFGFAFFYSLVGIPVARISERKNRVMIIAISLTIWSIATALCGLATGVVIFGIAIGAYWVLLLCRIVVGLGEAGCTPPANSLISDYYPPVSRSTAFGIYAMGVMLGNTLANLIGGPISDAFGWRVAFIAVGLPGVLLAFILARTIKEPPRGYSDPKPIGAVAEKQEAGTLIEALRELAATKAFVLMTIGATFAGFVAYGTTAFQSLYLQRHFDISAGQAALWINAPSFAIGALGAVAVGWGAQLLSSRVPLAVGWLAAAGLTLSIPFYWMAFSVESMTLCVIGLSIGKFLNYGYLTAQYTISQSVVSTRMRATAAAVLLFAINFLGYGLGPLFAGFVSDLSFSSLLRERGLSAILDRSICDGAQETVSRATLRGGELSQSGLHDILANLPAPLTPGHYASCLETNAASTQSAMLLLTTIYAVAAIFFAASSWAYLKGRRVVSAS